MKTTPRILFAVMICWIFASAGLQAQKPAEKKAAASDQTCIDKSRIDAAMQCERVYAPVCGCDGKTYQNQCDASRSGVKTFTKGECPGSVHEAVRKFIADWEAAYNAGDAKKLEAMFAPGAVQVRPDGEVYEGAAAISSRYAQGFKAPSKRAIDIQILEVVPLCDGKVWSSGIFTTTVEGNESGVFDQITGSYVTLMEQMDGKWVMVRHVVSNSTNEKAPVSQAKAGQ